ncbi:hypothetical protein MMC26_007070 [Xylographa opegraphella]|nr:hypothetical protein [Xylographa opegraphella]
MAHPGPITEVAIFPIASTTTIEQSGTKAGETWASLEETIRNVPGSQEIFWSRWVENKEMVQMIIHWESYDHHMRYRESPDFPGMIEKLTSLMNGKPVMYHVHFTPHPPDAAFNAPVLELFTTYFPASISEEEKTKWYHNFKNFMEQMIVDAEGLVAEAHGWVLEEVEHGKDDAKCKAFLCGIGWDSVDKHMGHRGTESFKSSIGLLREGSLSVEMHHVVFQGGQS